MVTLRKACREDAEFLARGLIMALGGVMNSDTVGVLTQLCQRDDTLYSWRHGVVAMLDGEPVGATIAYAGAGYHERMVHTFALAHDIIHFDVAQMEDETEAGEYYLDTLVVEPRHRREGIGATLVASWRDAGVRMGLTPTLACAKDNAPARRLYERAGLRHQRDIYIFGDWYSKMSLHGGG